jgi:predicted nucleic acid-binding protein
MILVDAGPLVALFDPRDAQHRHCAAVLENLGDKLFTTVAVLTEAFFILGPASAGAVELREMLRRGGLGIWWLSEESLERALRLMEIYADQTMDFADATLVAAAECKRVNRIFTIDRNDFRVYRAKFGHQLVAFEIV